MVRLAMVYANFTKLAVCSSTHKLMVAAVLACGSAREVVNRFAYVIVE